MLKLFYVNTQIRTRTAAVSISRGSLLKYDMGSVSERAGGLLASLAKQRPNLNQRKCKRPLHPAMS